jgi:hypothetical protein
MGSHPSIVGRGFLERVAPEPRELGPERGGHRRLERKVARVVDAHQKGDDVSATLEAPPEELELQERREADEVGVSFARLRSSGPG